MDEEGTIQTSLSKEDLEKSMKQEDNRTLKVNWKPAAGSPATEVDLEMKETARVTERLSESNYATK